jgi:hypothetical protein
LQGRLLQNVPPILTPSSNNLKRQHPLTSISELRKLRLRTQIQPMRHHRKSVGYGVLEKTVLCDRRKLYPIHFFFLFGGNTEKLAPFCDLGECLRDC